MLMREEPKLESIIEQKQQSKNLLPLQASLGVGYGSENQWFASLRLIIKKEKKFIFWKTFNFRILTEFLPEDGICLIIITSEIISQE
jgi:hypothetical protein